MCVDCPTYVTITPSNLTNGQVLVGTTFICTSDGYYTPKYMWYDSVSGLAVNGSQFTIPATGGPFSLTCVAAGDVPTFPVCNRTTNISGFAVGM